jgi:hypothetical protein
VVADGNVFPAVLAGLADLAAESAWPGSVVAGLDDAAESAWLGSVVAGLTPPRAAFAIREAVR